MQSIRKFKTYVCKTFKVILLHLVYDCFFATE